MNYTNGSVYPTNETVTYDRTGTLQIVFYSVIFPLGLIGNALTLCVVVKSVRCAKTRIPDVLIGCLALNDFLSVICIHSFSIVSMFAGFWVLGDMGCQYMSFMSYAYFKFGFWYVLAIAVDRSYRLVKPLRYLQVMTFTKLKVAISFIVIFSLGSSIVNPILDPDKVMLQKTWYVCFPEFVQGDVVQLVLVVSITTVFVPGVVIFIICYILNVIMLLRIRKESAMMRAGVVKASRGNETPSKKTSLTLFFNRNKLAFNNDLYSNNSTPVMKRNHSDGSIGVQTVSPILNRHLSCTPSINTEQHSRLHFFRQKSAPNALMQTSPYGSDSDLSINEDSPNSSLTHSKRKNLKKLHNSYISEMERNRKKTEKRRETLIALGFAKLSLVIATVFLALWLPYAAVIILGVGGVYNEGDQPVIQDVVIKFVFLNAATNPVLYGVFNKYYRDGYAYFVKLLLYYISLKRLKKPIDPISDKKLNLARIFAPMTATMKTAETLAKTLSGGYDDSTPKSERRQVARFNDRMNGNGVQRNGLQSNQDSEKADSESTTNNGAAMFNDMVENGGCNNPGYQSDLENEINEIDVTKSSQNAADMQKTDKFSDCIGNENIAFVPSDDDESAISKRTTEKASGENGTADVQIDISTKISDHDNEDNQRVITSDQCQCNGGDINAKQCQQNPAKSHTLARELSNAQSSNQIQGQNGSENFNSTPENEMEETYL